MDEGDDFSQGFILPPLISQLRKILDQYPDDTQILKELIQNAEDAGANVIKFLYDKHTYGTDSKQLYNAGLGKFQGPAIYAFNNGLFDEEDWKGLRMLSESVKQNDPFKVGYFGMGFKSVFHLTDLPSVLSGEKLGMIDPHQLFFPNSSHGWNIAKNQDLLKTLRHQVDPYLGLFDCDENTFKNGYYKGTLFRFPLRCAPSPLSKEPYSQDKVYALFDSFRREAHFLPIFLRNLEKIEIYERDKFSPTPKLLFRLQITEDCLEEIRKKRTDFLKRTRSSDWLDKPIVTTYLMKLETTVFQQNGYTEKPPVKAVHQFLITSYYCGGQLSAAFSKLHRDTELNYLPWVGTAMPLGLKVTPDIYNMTDSDGHIFCFLPLPLEENSTTGLPVHVNGFFALEQNRKHIKWPGAYKSRDDLMDKRLLWNQCILKEALPKAYARMIMEAIQMHIDDRKNADVAEEVIYRAFPDFSKVDRKWECVLPILYAELFKHPTVYTMAEGGRWIEPRLAIFNTLEENEVAADVILTVLTEGAIRVVNAPSHVLQAIKKCCHINIIQITPPIVASTYRNVQYSCTFHWEEKMKLLRYFLQQTKVDLLDGLQLLPIANGGFHIFHYNPKKADRPIYIATSNELVQLLPGLTDDLLEMDIDKDIKKSLMKAASKGFTQLKIIDAAILGELIPRCMPPSWKEVQNGVVEWMPGEMGHPDDGWLESLWGYLVQNSPRDLSSVEKLPILPGRTIMKVVPGKQNLLRVIELVPLSNSKVSLTRHMDGISLGADIEEIARKIGITVVDDLPDYIKIHPLITKNYVFSSSYIGVLRAINRLCETEGKDTIMKRISEMTSVQEKRCLRELFAKISMYEMQKEYHDLLLHLPLFETLAGSRGKESQFICLAKVNVAAPLEKLPFPLSSLLLDISSTDSQILAKLLNIRQLNLAQLLSQVVFRDIERGFYSPSEIENVMLYVLRHYHQFIEMEETFKTTLKALPFLDKKDLMVTADRFYDPDQELLQKMFQFEDKFPSGIYSDPAVVAVLREIGLRGSQDVDVDDIKESAKCLERLSMESDARIDKLIEKSSAIIEYLQRYQIKLNALDFYGIKLSEGLREIAWVCCMSQHPIFYPQCLPWHNNSRTFNKPSEMTGKKYINLIGSVRSVNSAEMSATLERAFGFDKPPPLVDIIRHLGVVVLSYDPHEKILFMELARSIYSELMKHDPDEVARLLDEHVTKNWIWSGEGFVPKERIVFNQPFMDLRPFIHSLPTELVLFSDFFSKFGVQKMCSLAEVLKMIRKKHCSTNGTNEQDADQTQLLFSVSEVKRDLHICVSILNELKSHITDETELASLQNDLFLPVHVEKQGILKMAPISECTYCDEEWLRQGYSSSDFGMNDDNCRIALVHPNVPTSTSEALGVPTLMSRMLDAEELDISFGQTDSLTHRLNTLLQEYSDGFAVPKELVQNADDAGATRVCFLYDERENEDSRTCLIDEGMRDCQGPAIWVYNDAVFRDEDFENITKLSGATKEKQPEKIGRFGLGFNAVYNLTDVPSFVSNHSIVIFDPHTTHLGKSIKNKFKPGIRIDLRRHRRNLRRFGNQFKPYNEIFGCNLRPECETDSFNGTLFRFPLRTKSQAALSEICSKHYDDKEMKELLRMLAQSCESLLLFAQSVSHISISYLPKKGIASRDIVEVFSMEKRLVKVLRELTPFEKNDEEKVQLAGQCSTLKASVKVLDQLRGGTKLEAVDVPDSSVLVDLDKQYSNKCDTIFDSRIAKSKLQTWIVCSLMGTGESLRMALQEDHLLSTVGIAVPLEAAGTGYKPLPLVDPSDSSLLLGSVFSFMPLPVRCGLPVHINGAFAVSSNRKYLCQQNEDDKFDMRPVWNKILMQDALCSVYIKLLLDLASLFDPAHSYDFHLLWPNPSHMAEFCEPMAVSFYKQITTKGSTNPSKIFSDGCSWASIDDTMFLDFAYSQSEVGKTADTVFHRCVVDGTRIVATLPGWMKDALELAKVEASISSNSYNIVRFFREIFLPNISMVDPEDRDKLLLDALKQNEELLNTVIADNKCIPVSPCGENIQSVENLIDPTSYLAQLYTEEDGRFPFGKNTYSSPEILHLLRSIGMKNNLQQITWEDLIERADAISCTASEVSSKCMVTALLSVLAQKLNDESTSTVARRTPLRSIQESLAEIAFLPLMKKPNLFPFFWKGDDFPSGMLLKPSELYPAEYWDLVCCVRPVLDSTVFPVGVNNIQTFLRISPTLREPLVEDVVEQLDVIINSSTEGLLNTKTFDEIQRICFKVCDFLHRQLGNGAVRKILAEDLKGKSFILAHNKFLSPNQVAFKFPHNCAPYLYSLPDYHKRNFAELLSLAGVREQFDTSDYVRSLQEMHEKHGTDKLDKDSLKLALQLVSLLNDRIAEQGRTLKEVVDAEGTIYIPDGAECLRSASELCYNEPDCQWVPTTDATSFSHPLIPYSISKQLGVNTSRQEVLRKHSQGIPFGQRERLTNRIKRILSGYPCDKEILKELLQNADDAGATEIHFIKDPRQHGTERVFDKSWRPLQGPALCIYNNQSFSETDLEAIQRLGEGSKGSDPNKTGQYGVGFNCVYHLTDAPSFLTRGPDVGESLCIFDPHAKFVPGSSKQEPGRRFQNVSHLKTIFTDVFNCYLEDKFDLSNGTMFRLPLRDEKMAKESELSDHVVTLDSIDQLFSKFRVDMMDNLIFLNNINTISLSEIDKITGKLVNIYTVSVDMSKSDQISRINYGCQLKAMAAEMESADFTEVQVREHSYTIKIYDNKSYWEKWMLTQRIGIGKEVEVASKVVDAFRRKELMLMPRGGVAALVDSSDFRAARKRTKKLYCFLPLPNRSPFPVHINGHFALDHEARRNLWYDEDGGAKTEWNNLIMRRIVAPAYVILLKHLSSAVSDLVNSRNNLVKEATLNIGCSSLEIYSQLFPNLTEETVGYWQVCAEAVYRHIHESGSLVLPVVRKPRSFSQSPDIIDSDEDIPALTQQIDIEWTSTGGNKLQRAYFDNLDATFVDEEEDNKQTPNSRRRHMTSVSVKTDRCETLRQVLLLSGFQLLALPLEIFKSFTAAGIQVECISPATIVNFYRSHDLPSSMCSIGKLPCDISKTPFADDKTLRILLNYCLQDSCHFYDNLYGLPLLLTEDNRLQCFSNIEPVYHSRYYDILPGMGGKFLHHTLMNHVFVETDQYLWSAFLHFDVEAFAKLLPNILPKETFRMSKWVLRCCDDENGFPSAAWLSNVWTFLRKECESTTDKQHIAEVVLKPINEWNLLPAYVKTFSVQSDGNRRRYSSVSGEDTQLLHYLIPIQLASTVVDYTQTGMMVSPVKQCLRKFGVPELNCEILDSNASASLGTSGKNLAHLSSNFAKMLVSSLDDPSSVLNAVLYVMRDNGTKISMQQEDCLVLLKYFSDSIESWRHNLNTRLLLRGAPLHINAQDEVTAISDYQVFILLDRVPACDFTPWQKHSGTVFLQCNAALVDLYEALGCQTLVIKRLYLDFIFKNFDYLMAEERLVHLQFLKDVFLGGGNEKDKTDLIQALSRLNFIPKQDGRLYKASDFFDPHHPVFKIMLAESQDAFPSAPFCEYKWLDFMRSIGLRSKVNKALFEKFAFEIGEEAKMNPSELTCEKSKILVTHMFQLENIVGSGLLENIADIKFIPAAKGKPIHRKIYPAFGGVTNENTTKFIAFNQGIPEHHEVLVWTSAYLLPDWANPYILTANDINFVPSETGGADELTSYKKQIGATLMIKENPTLDLVVEHLLNLCSGAFSPASSDDNREFKAYMRMDVMKKVYHYLQTMLLQENVNVDELREKISRLSDVPCIVSEMGQKFVKPKQVVIDLYEEDQIIPYLYKAPTELGEFKSLFVFLGATVNVTAEQYSSVLENLHSTTKEEKLHPNEMRLAFKAIAGLFTTIHRLKQSSELANVNKLYLPTDSGCLLSTTDIYFNDEPTWNDRIKKFNKPFLVNLAECKLPSDSHLDMIKLLPSHLRLIMLSSIVQESLEEKLLDNRLLHTVADKLRYQLNSKAFALGLARLIKHEHRRSGHKVRQQVFDSIQQQLKGVHVYGVEKVVTYLMHGGQKIPESESESECFVDKKVDGVSGLAAWDIYINKSVKLEEELQVCVAEAVNKISGGLLKNSVHYVQPMLSCPPHSISKVLDRLKIRPDRKNNNDVFTSTLPAAGSFIPVEDHHLLMEEFEEFETGEYVGYELDDELSGEATVIYAIIIKKIEGDDFVKRKLSVSEGTNGSIGNGHGILTQRYLINVGEDRESVTALSADLYKFHRVGRYMNRMSNGDVENSPKPGHCSTSKSPKTSFSDSYYTQSSVFEPIVDKSAVANQLVVCNGNGHGGKSEKTEKSNKIPSKNENKVIGEKPKNGFIKPQVDEVHDHYRESEQVFENAEKNSSDELNDSSAEESAKTDQSSTKTEENIESDDSADSFEAILNEVSCNLEEAWSLPEVQRKKIIKRLLLKWHPDKNLGNEELATRVVQHIYSEIGRLEMGLPRPKQFEEFKGQFQFDPRNPFAGSETFQQNFYNAYQFFFDQLNRRAKEHREQQERYRENFTREYSSSKNTTFNFGVPPTFTSTNPQPAQAKRFLRQAQEDLKAANNDFETATPAYEWVCFKAHQAAEKALKAAQFYVDAVSSFSHDLVSLAASLEDLELRRLAQRLQKIVGNSNKLYNPEPIDFVVIPHDEYTKDMSSEAVDIAQSILGRVTEIVEVKD